KARKLLPHLASYQPQRVGGLNVRVAIFYTIIFLGCNNGISFSRRQEQILLQSLLPGIEIVIASLSGVELLMRATFDDLPLLHNQNLIGAADGGKPVRDDERCPALHEIRKPVLDHRLRFRIQAGCGFVEDQDSRLGKNRARNRDALPWSAGKFHAALDYSRSVFIRKAPSG